MKIKSLVLMALLLLSGEAFASPISADTIYNGRAVMPLPSTAASSGAILSTNSSATVRNKTYDESSNVPLVLQGLYDYSVSGGDTNTDYDLGALPQGAIITDVFASVITAPVKLYSTPTIGVSTKNPQDLFSDTGIANYVPVSFFQGRVYGTTASYIRLSAATHAYLNLKGGSLSAGKIRYFIKYLISN